MSNSRLYLIIFVGLIITSCKEEKGNYLSENEQYEVLKQGLIPYLDSVDRDYIFYDHFLKLDTSTYLEILSSKETPIFVIDTDPNLKRTKPELKPIKTNELSQLDFVNWEEVEYIRSSYTDSVPNYTTVYGINLPFKPDTSETALVGIIPFAAPDICNSYQTKFLLLEKFNGKWRVTSVE
ncbi:MAG: hypothetical protein H6582_00990 [Crocinitomicaceae bacterium]|nr:hypothetical protein [Crocinitomicaceae bacterium]